MAKVLKLKHYYRLNSENMYELTYSNEGEQKHLTTTIDNNINLNTIISYRGIEVKDFCTYPSYPKQLCEILFIGQSQCSYFDISEEQLTLAMEAEDLKAFKTLYGRKS